MATASGALDSSEKVHAEITKKFGDASKLPTLRTVMLKGFGWCVVTCLVLVLALVLVNIFVIGASTRNEATDGLTEQIQTHMKTACEELAATIDMQLKKVEDNVVRFTRSVASQATESGFPLDAKTDYRDTNLPNSVQTSVERRGNTQASLSHSIWYVPAGTSITGGVTSLATQSSHLNAFFRILWDSETDVVAMYVGYESWGLFRHYPGFRLSDNTYDPRARPWYAAATAASSSEVAHSDPYEDQFGQGWMISLAQQVRTPGGTLIGVASCDLKITAIQAAVAEVTFFGASTASLVAMNGQVVASPLWVEGKEVTNGATNAQGDDRLPNLLWTAIKDTANPNAAIFDHTDAQGKPMYLARAFLPAKPDDGSAWVPRYVVLNMVLVSDAEAPLVTMEDNLNDSTLELVLISVACTLITLIAVACIGRRLAGSITDPLVEMRKAANRITSNAGADLGQGIRPEDVSGGDGEVGEFVDEFKTMLGGLTKKGGKATAATATLQENPYHNGAKKLPWDEVLNDARAFAQSFTGPTGAAVAAGGAGAGAGAGTAGAGAGAGGASAPISTHHVHTV